MTAFARVQAELPAHSLIWEMRSVNHRFLETSLRMPEGARHLEHGLKETLRHGLKRGKIDATLRIDVRANATAMAVDAQAVTAVAHAVAEVQQHLPEATPPSALDVLRFPGVMSTADSVGDELDAAIEASFREALDALIAHRSREGEQLRTVLVTRLEEAQALTGAIAADAADMSAQVQKKLLARLAELQENLTTPMDDSRLEQEVALLAQKADIAEELDRLGIHVAAALQALQQPGPHGRRLDFLTQELNREANTIASKSISPQTSQHAVNLKVIIEQIREQVQNIE